MTTLTRRDALNKIFDLHYADGDGGVVEFADALLYAWGDGDDIPRIIDQTDDIYAALSSLAVGVRDKEIAPPHGIILCTSGWASPIDKTGKPPTDRPSQHPERRRCSLWVAATVDGQVTRCALAREDGTAEIVSDEDEDSPSGHGALAEAVDMVGVTLWGMEYAARLFTAAMFAEQDSEQARQLNHRAALAVRGAAIIENMTDDEGGE